MYSCVYICFSINFFRYKASKNLQRYKVYFKKVIARGKNKPRATIWLA